MANKKVTETPLATTVADADYHLLVQGGVTKHISHANILVSTAAQTANTFGEGSHDPSTFTNSFDQHATTPLKVVVAGLDNKAVYFRGQLDCSMVTFTPGSFVSAFRLATICRPKVNSHFLVPGLYDSIAICAIHTDGFVYFQNLVGDVSINGVIDLSTIHYYKDPF